MATGSLPAQTLTNLLWEKTLLYPDTVQWQDQLLSGSNLFTCGNTFQGAAEKSNIVTTKLDQGGNIVWQTEYNGTLSGFDYGAAMTIDGSGNVFVTGATHNTSASSFDIVVLKYNSSGVQQWATLYNGTGSDMDIPSDIILVGTDVYVCGASVGSGGTQYDYVLLKLNASGTLQWSQRYDYDSLYDIPGHLATNGTDFVVSGASQSTATNWDYTSLRYNSSGTLVTTQRSSAPGYGYDRPTGLVTDATGNFYITGYAYNGSNYDMRTVKLDDDLSPVWTVTENGGADDGANGIALDGSGNVYICGYKENTAGGEEIQVIKYNSSGTKQWTKTLQNTNNTYKAQATAITWNSTGGLVVTGYMQTPSTTKQITTFRLNTANGNVQMKRDYHNLAGSIDYPTGIEVNNNHIWVTGQTTIDDTVRYVTLKYETYEQLNEIVYDSLGIPMYVKDQIIVRFSPYSVQDEFVNEIQKVYESLSNVVNASTYSKIQPILCEANTQFNPTAIKVYKRFLKSDSTFITRLGTSVRSDKLWSTMIIELPDSSDIDFIIDTLNSIVPEVIYAQKNYVYSFTDVPNDTEWPNQHSLFSTMYPDAHINIKDAWDVYLGAGNPEIKIGVYDSGIDWEHEDFGDGTYWGSKIEGGYNYKILDGSVDGLLDPIGHGTSCAGIIGALRNNAELGIAGIAGGNTDDLSNNGVSLYAMKIADEVSYLPFSSELANAYLEGAILYNLDITNHSYSGPSYDQVTRDGMEILYKCESIFVASRGNFPNRWGTAVDDPMYPACFSGDRVINVGGSGTDGERKVNGNGNLGLSEVDMDDNEFQSMTNYGVDIIAPSTTALVLTTKAGTNDYHGFNGTSAAVPHVVGLAALMQSFYGEMLAPEDIERIIENNAVDVNVTFHDSETGYGRIDAEATLKQLVWPQYQVIHFSGTTGTYVDELLALQDVTLNEYFGTLGLGNYLAEVHDISYTYSHVIPATAEVVDSWVRNSTSNGFSSGIIGSGHYNLPALNGSVKIFIDESSAEIKTRLFKVTHQQISGTYVDVIDTWVPVDPSEIILNYSLHIHDPFAGTEIAELNLDKEIALFPNPVDESLNLFLFEGLSSSLLEVYSIEGKLIEIITLDSVTNNRITVDVSNYLPGIYFVHISNKGISSTATFIKL